eukprot:4948376-Heterocapsa_arctica.AAC.1
MRVEVQSTLEVGFMRSLEQVVVLAQVERGQAEDVLHRGGRPSLQDGAFDRVRDRCRRRRLILTDLLIPDQDLVEERFVARPRGDQDPAENGTVPAGAVRL